MLQVAIEVIDSNLNISEGYCYIYIHILFEMLSFIHVIRIS